MRRLDGMPVANALSKQLAEQVMALGKKGIVPRLAVVRVGEREEDLSYEKSILKRFSALNAAMEVIALPAGITQDVLESTIISLNKDRTVHGILLFRPLPKQLSEDGIKSIIAPEKDVDCMGIFNIACLFAGNKKGFPPCTPQAVIELLDFYGIDVEGKKATIVGRSLVVGRPLAMLLLSKSATVTVCHTKTAALAEECKNADILIACAGAAKMITSDFTNHRQTVIDVGINMKDGKLCGDVDYDDVADKVGAITPVPGGVGAITTLVLLKHTILSALDASLK